MGDDALRVLFKKLDRSRVDLFVENKVVALKQAKDMGMLDKIRIIDIGSVKDAESSLYIAFSPANPKSPEYAKILSDGIAELRVSGRIAEILAKYGLQDWE